MSCSFDETKFWARNWSFLCSDGSGVGPPGRYEESVIADADIASGTDVIDQWLVPPVSASDAPCVFPQLSIECAAATVGLGLSIECAPARASPSVSVGGSSSRSGVGVLASLVIEEEGFVTVDVSGGASAPACPGGEAVQSGFRRPPLSVKGHVAAGVGGDRSGKGSAGGVGDVSGRGSAVPLMSGLQQSPTEFPMSCRAQKAQGAVCWQCDTVFWGKHTKDVRGQVCTRCGITIVMLARGLCPHCYERNKPRECRKEAARHRKNGNLEGEQHSLELMRGVPLHQTTRGIQHQASRPRV